MIQRRKTFYLSGFDPRGARYYRQLFLDNASGSEAQTGEKITRETVENEFPEYQTVWSVRNAAQNTQTDFAFLKWDDIVREHWIKNPFRLALETLKTYFLYLTNLEWRSKHLLTGKGPLIALFYPFITLIVAWAVFYFLLGYIGEQIGFRGGLFYNLLLISAAMFPASLILDKIKSFWLLRFFIFNAKAFHITPDLPNERLEKFREMVTAALNNPAYDEVTLCTHSNGTILSVPLIASLYRTLPPEKTNKLQILSIGQCLPLATFYKSAKKLKADLKFLSETDLTWFDIGSPADGVCFALQDPFLPDNPPHAERKAKAVLHTPQFHKYYSKATYAALRKNKFDLHFRYFTREEKQSPMNLIALLTSKTPLAVSLQK